MSENVDEVKLKLEKAIDSLIGFTHDEMGYIDRCRITPYIVNISNLVSELYKRVQQ